MNQRKYLVLGSNSFAGSNFIKYILEKEKKSKIIGISRSKEYPAYFLNYKKINNKNFKFIRIDLKNTNKIINLVKNFRPDFILNYSAQGMVNESWENPLIGI